MERSCRHLVVALSLACSMACQPTKNEAPAALTSAHPAMYLTEDRRAVILDNIQTMPMASVYADLQMKATAELVVIDPDDWHAKDHGKNGEVAAVNAFLAWLHADEAAAQRAVRAMETLTTNWDDHTGWGINIRMPGPLMHYTAAWDFLKATPFYSEAQAQVFQDKLTTITEQFFRAYVLDDTTRHLALTVTQNNHPIRTAAAIGFVGLAFPDHPDSTVWVDWAVSELFYLLGPEGQYVQPDGAVSEGPFYFNYGFAPAIAFFIALKNRADPDRLFRRDCINRSDVDPWSGHGCIDGESFRVSDPMTSQLFHRMMDWSLALRLPNGNRAPIGDSPLRNQSAPAVFRHFGGPDYLYWDWATNPSDPFKVKGGFDLAITHLAYVTAPAEIAPPPWKNRFFVAGGMATFRSGWTSDDRVLVLMGEHGAARKTVHDHSDGTSFVMAAYGDLLFTDTGYYKPDTLQNAITSTAGSHNLILVDGQGAPAKGLLNDWGDADAFIENTLDGERLAYAESRQTYQNTRITRGVAFVRARYFVVADRLTADDDEAREYRFRLHSYAGRDLDGQVTLETHGPHVQRDNGSVSVFTASSQGPCSLEEPPFVSLASPHVHKLDKDPGHHTVTDAVVTGVSPDFLTVLAPYKTGAVTGADAPMQVTPIETTHGAAWRIESDGAVDVAWIREDGAPTELTVAEGRTLTTDGDFVLVSLDGSMGLLVRGTSLRLDDAVIISADGETVSAKQ